MTDTVRSRYTGYLTPMTPTTPTVYVMDGDEFPADHPLVTTHPTLFVAVERDPVLPMLISDGTRPLPDVPDSAYPHDAQPLPVESRARRAARRRRGQE